MKILSLYLFVLLYLAGVSYASTTDTSQYIGKRSFNERQRFLLQGNAMYFVNRPDVETIVGGKDFMTANNTIGWQVGVAYEYINKRNISFTVFTNYGVQKHDFIWVHRFDNFDPRVDLSSQNETTKFNSTTPYLNTGVLIGYDHKIWHTKKWYAQIKAGVGNTHYLKENTLNTDLALRYQSAPNVMTHAEYSRLKVSTGTSPTWLPYEQLHFNLYLGISIPVHTVTVKNLKLGITYTRIRPINDEHESYASGSYYRLTNERYLVQDGWQEYKGRFRSLGVMLSLCF